MNMGLFDSKAHDLLSQQPNLLMKLGPGVGNAFLKVDHYSFLQF